MKKEVRESPDPQAEAVCGRCGVTKAASIAGVLCDPPYAGVHDWPAPSAEPDGEACASNTNCRGTCEQHSPVRPEHRAPAPAQDGAVDEALADIGLQARADEACSICHASVRPDRRDRHLDWHASLSRDVERDRLPQVYGTRDIPPGSGRDQ